MKPFIPILLGLATLGTATLVQTTSGAEAEGKAAFPLEGTWRWNFTMPDGIVTRPKLRLTTENGQIIGVTSFRSGTETAITNALLTGDLLSFQVIRRREGQDITTTYSGRWSDKTIKGKIESNWAGEKQTYDWVAERAHLGVEGAWRWTNSFFSGRGGGRPGGGRGRGFESRVELEQEGEKISGHTVGRFGRTSITNGVFTNGVIYFEIERVFGETRNLTRHHGRQIGDIITGTLESEVEGEDRTIDWEATRVD